MARFRGIGRSNTRISGHMDGGSHHGLAKSSAIQLPILGRVEVAGEQQYSQSAHILSG